MYAHGGVISALSTPLDRLINGPMREGQSCTVYFPELEPSDFERICEFAYRGDYTVPRPVTYKSEGIDKTLAGIKLAKPPKKISRDLDLAAFEAMDDSSVVSSEKPANLPSHFSNKTYPLVGWTGKQISRLGDIEPNCKWTQDFTPVFLGHARLYGFARMYMIAELRNLALHKLHRTLKKFTLFTSGFDAIIELVRYAYDTDHVPDRDHYKVDQLRELVLEYVVMHISNFNKSDVHRRFLEEQGEYAADLLDVVSSWLL